MASGQVEGRRGVAKQANARLVMDALRRSGPASQAAIARATGLSRATVNGLVQRLRDEGVIDFGQANGRESIISLSARQGIFVTVEVHARLLRGALFDFRARRRVDASSIMEPDATGSTTPAMVEALVRRLTQEAQTSLSALAGVAIAIEGPIQREAGTIASWAWSRLPGWRDVQVARELTERLGVPTLADNDANLAALAEWTWGAGQGCADFLYVICSEGVGGGIIIDGNIYHGGTGLAGEIGHMVVEEAGGLCFCGSRGCLSGFVSERAILAALAASEAPKQALAEVIEAAQRGDATCQRVLFDAGRHLGKALAAVARVVAPSMVVIGGRLGSATFLMEGLQSSAEVINLRAFTPSLSFRSAAIASDEIVLGALAAVLAGADQGASAVAEWMLAHAPDPNSLAA